MRNEAGDLPVFIALANQAPAGLVSALVGAFSACCREKDEFGALPLHVALEKEVPVEAVRPSPTKCCGVPVGMRLPLIRCRLLSLSLAALLSFVDQRPSCSGTRGCPGARA